MSLAFRVACIFNTLSVLLILPFFFGPRGTPTHPGHGAGAFFWALLIALLSVMINLPLSIREWRAKRKNARLGLLLSLTPLPLFIVLLKLAVWLGGFTID